MTDLEQAPPRRKRRFVRALLILLALAVLATGVTVGYTIWALGGSEEGEPVQIVVREGASGAEIADQLAAKDVIRSAAVFRIVARLRGVGGDLKPGAYEMRVGLGVSGAIEALLEGVPIPVETFTIPEGKTVIEIARIIGRSTHLSRRAFLREARSGEHRIDVLPGHRDELEGLLFPKTYEITVETSAADVVRLLLRQFEIETTDLDTSAAEHLGVTPYEIVIIASLIEREAKLDEDRRKVASVIYNRLERGMRLQIDATVQYAILRQTGRYKENLTQDDYTAVRSPYNTYQIDGLPPGPIASPGLPSLRAALDPADTDFLFYRLYRDSQRHCFSTDSAGHAACGNRTEP